LSNRIFLVGGAVISCGDKTSFNTPSMTLDTSALEAQETHILECEVHYGRPRIMERAKMCRVRIDVFPKNNATQIRYEVNEDVARKISQP
jgi:hypothetical protein